MDQNTSMINWTFPTAPPFSGEATRGYDDPHGAQAAGYYQDGGHSGGHGYDQYGGGHDQYDEHGEKKEKKDKKDKKDDSSKNMMMGAAAGVGVGVVGGVLLANALGKFFRLLMLRIRVG